MPGVLLHRKLLYLQHVLLLLVHFNGLTMSILKYLIHRDCIPDNSDALTEILGSSILKETYEYVRKVLESPVSSATDKSTKSGKYIKFSLQDPAKIGKYCAESEPIATVRKFHEKNSFLTQRSVPENEAVIGILRLCACSSTVGPNRVDCHL